MTSSADDTTSYSVVDDDVTTVVTASNPACTRLYIASSGQLNILDISGWNVAKKEVKIEDFHPTCLQCYKNLLIYVPQHHRRKVICINGTTKKKISELTFGQEVTGIKINGSGHILFILQSDISIYQFSVYGLRPQHDLSGLQYLHPNKVAISSNDIIACPTIDIGNTSLQIYSIKTQQTLATIVASQSPISCVTMNNDGTMVATTSEKGTIIRLFSATNGRLIQELRRGLMRCADIKSLVFSADSAFLACSSSTETIHIYKLDAHVAEDAEQEGWLSYLSNSVLSTASLLTAGTTDTLFLGRSFATISTSADCMVQGFITSGADVVTVGGLVITDGTGVVRIFSIDSVNGGECELKTEYLLENGENA